MRNTSFALGLCALFLSTGLLSQEYELGQSSFDSTGYIEFVRGNLPLILSAPHGGEQKPDEIPDRQCSGCVYSNDLNTQELVRELAQAIEQRIGCRPHLVINRLHRVKLDANRAIGEAADGNDIAEQSWQAYHSFVQQAISFIEEEDDSTGLFLDLHGHGHDIQRVELGYLLSKNDLMQSDAVLDQQEYIDKSSVQALLTRLNGGQSLSEIIRGDDSMGVLLEDKNVDAVPSDKIEFPEDNEPYFSGGYNTRLYGIEEGSQIDAIQIECHQEVRFNDSQRLQFAEHLADVIIQFLETYYGEGNWQSRCLTSAQVGIEQEGQITIFPNPAQDGIEIKGIGMAPSTAFRVVSISGSSHKVYVNNGRIDVGHLSDGMYTLFISGRSATSLARFVILR